MIVTIDGPTASGKSSVARDLAYHLSMYYLYSGLLYRGIAYLLWQSYGYDYSMIANVRKEDLDACVASLSYVFSPARGALLYADSHDITSHLKLSYIDNLSSIVSINAQVRDTVYHLQHTIADTHDIVVDGRDTGTSVFPHATYKFYLTAHDAIRARRWQQDQYKRGKTYTFAESLQKLRARDHQDTQRVLSPLLQAADAYHVDNSHLNITETVGYMCQYIHTCR